MQQITDCPPVDRQNICVPARSHSQNQQWVQNGGELSFTEDRDEIVVPLPATPGWAAAGRGGRGHMNPSLRGLGKLRKVLNKLEYEGTAT